MPPPWNFITLSTKDHHMCSPKMGHFCHQICIRPWRITWMWAHPYFKKESSTSCMSWVWAHAYRQGGKLTCRKSWLALGLLGWANFLTLSVSDCSLVAYAGYIKQKPGQVFSQFVQVKSRSPESRLSFKARLNIGRVDKGSKCQVSVRSNKQQPQKSSSKSTSKGSHARSSSWKCTQQYQCTCTNVLGLQIPPSMDNTALDISDGGNSRCL